MQANTHHNKITIVVDGTSGSGKGTLSKALAKQLNFAYLDTGLLYRFLGWFAINNNLFINKQITNIAPILQQSLKINFAEVNVKQLSNNNVAEAASAIAQHTQIRQNLLQFQHNFAINPILNGTYVGGSVLDGRDLGSVVFPNANVKFFVNANLQVRAQRRFKDLYGSMPILPQDSIKFNNLYNSLKNRDHQDTTRKNAPLIQTADAIFIDNSSNSVEYTVTQMLNYVKQTCNIC